MYNSKFINLVSLETFCLIEEHFYSGWGRVGGDIGKTNEIRGGSELRDTA